MRSSLNNGNTTDPRGARARAGHALLLALVLAFVAGGPARAGDDEPTPIQDNSFLVEEAYNQEDWVMQTIQTFARERGSGEWLYTLTQEYPTPGQAHQLSFTLPLQGTAEGNRGVGDLLVNYRFQLFGNGETTHAFSPRVSLVVPTGKVDRGLGQGGWGAQVNLPLSAMLGKRFVSHTNLGGTWLAGADAGDDRSFFAGQSLIWLAHPNVNLMLEGVVSRGFGGNGTEPHTDVTLVPGVRFAINLGGLQVVPGLAYLVGVGPSSGQRGVFFYLSLEHPFKKLLPKS